MAAGSSTVATLVLALQARNETRAGFEAVRRDLQQQTEAARRAAAEQTLAVRQATQQQLLEIRQRTAAEALALRQSVAGQALATRQAMEQRIQMLRQDAEQTALLAREGARAQIEAITLTRDADIRAARERALATERMLRTQEDAARITAAKERTSAREGGGGAMGLMERVPGSGLLESMGRFGAQMVLWNVGYAAVNRVTEAVGGLASGLVTVNAFLENFHQTMAAIYHSDAAATQATDWLTQFALRSPDTREHVFSAAEELAPLGVNLKEVMPAIGNVSAIMNVDETRGAQAFADAFEGRFVMLQQTLHITKGELVKFGLELDHNGHVLNNSFVPAFEKLAAAKYGEGMKKQMDTVSGVFSNVHDAIQTLQAVMGKPMFNLIRKDLQDFLSLLMSPQAMGAAHMFGVGLGNAFHAMSEAVRAAGPIVLGAIGFIIGAWNAAAPAIQNAVAFINNVVQRVGAFLHDTVLPVIFQGLAAASLWWQQHAEQVKIVAQKIFDLLQVLWGSLATNMKAAFDILHGIWMVGWGLISGGFGLALDLMTGNWRQFGIDLDSMATNIAVGLLEIFHGLFSKLVDLFARLPNPLDAILHKLDQPAMLAFLQASGHAGLANIIQVAAAASTIGRSGHLTAAQFDQQVKLAGDAAVAARGGQDLTPGQLAHIRNVAQGEASKRLLPLLNAPAGATSATQTALDAYFTAQENDLRRKANLLTGAPSTYDGTIKDTTAGQNIFDDWMDKLKALQKSGLTLPGFTWGADGTPPGTGVDWTGGGGGEPFDPRSANSAQQKAIADAQTRFQLHLAQGGITQAQGMRDINAILAADKAGGATGNQLLLTALQDTQTLDNQLLAVAQKKYDFDAGVAHPDRQKLHQDELAYLKIMAQTPGMTPLDVATARQQWDARIDQLTGSRGRDRADDALKQFKWDTGVAHPALATLKRDEAAYLALYAKQAGITLLDVKLMRRDLDKQIEQATKGTTAAATVAPVPRYGGLAGETGYGQTTVSFGGAQANPLQAIVAELRNQLAFWKGRAERDERVIALLEGVDKTGGLQLGVLRDISGGVLHPGPPAPPRSAHSVLRAAGNYAPVLR